MWPFLALIGLGLGAVQTGASRAIVGGAPPEQAGIAGGLQGTAAQTGGVLGLSVLGSIITSRVTSVLPHRLIAAGTPAPLAAHLKGAARAVAEGVVPIPRGAPVATARAITNGSFSAFTSGLDTAMAVGAGLIVVAGIAAFLSVSSSGQSIAVEDNGISDPRPSDADIAEAA
jgi:hypothetical protein